MQNIDQTYKCCDVAFDFPEDMLINAIAKVLISNGARALKCQSIHHSNSVVRQMEKILSLSGSLRRIVLWFNYLKSLFIIYFAEWIFPSTRLIHFTTSAGHRQLSTECISAEHLHLNASQQIFKQRLTTARRTWSRTMPHVLSPGQIDFVGCFLHLYDRITFNTKKLWSISCHYRAHCAFTLIHPPLV